MNTSTPDIIKRIVDGATTTTAPAEVLTAPPETKPVNEVTPAEPPMYAVIVYNDATTEGNFAAHVMQEHFGIPRNRAHQIMMAAHRNGQAVVQIVAKEVAETRIANAQVAINQAREGVDHVNHGGTCQLRFDAQPETKGE